MTNLNYNGQLISQREDNYVNATEMCKATSKKVNDWLRLKSTLEYKEALSVDTGIPVTLLIEASDAGTFVHPLLALQIGRWVSPQFAIWCDTHIKTLMETGKTEIPQEPKKTYTNIEYIEASDKLERINNETLKQLLRDRLIDELSVARSNKQLPAEDIKQYTTVKVRATELGYTLTQIGNGSQLGKYIKKHVDVAFSERIGKYDTKHYEVSDLLDTEIHNFFSMRDCLS